MYHHDLGWNICFLTLCPTPKATETHTDGMERPLTVEQWTDIAQHKFDSDTIVVHGISMGAATTMCMSGDETPSYVRAFIEDCGYTSVWDEFSGELNVQFGLPPFPLLHTTSLLCKIQNGWSFKEASPLKQMSKCRKPMLFIHGTADTYVPTKMVFPLFEAKAQPKEIWLAKGSKHAEAYKDHHEEYTKVVEMFIKTYILGSQLQDL